LQIASNVTEKDYIQQIDFDDSLAQNDEIGELSKSFSSMIKSMKDQFTDVCKKCGTRYRQLDEYCKNCGEIRPLTQKKE